MSMTTVQYARTVGSGPLNDLPGQTCQLSRDILRDDNNNNTDNGHICNGR